MKKSPPPPRLKRIEKSTVTTSDRSRSRPADTDRLPSSPGDTGESQTSGPRLDELVASRCVHARRTVQELIRSGRVTVDGIIVTEPGLRIEDESLLTMPGAIQLEGKSLDRDLPSLTYILHKARGFISTRKDPEMRPTVMDMIPAPLRQLGLVPVGRLDADTSGLLLLSNDGDLVHQLTHPRHNIPKVYKITLKGRMSPRQRFRLETGINLDGRVTRPAIVEGVRNDRDTTTFNLTIYEGRNRQIREMCKKIGLNLVQLHRIAVGPIVLGDLRVGTWRELTREELADLQVALDNPEPNPAERSKPVNVESVNSFEKLPIRKPFHQDKTSFTKDNKRKSTSRRPKKQPRTEGERQPNRSAHHKGPRKPGRKKSTS